MLLFGSTRLPDENINLFIRILVGQAHDWLDFYFLKFERVLLS
jgi:hypothetical protein